MDEYDMTDYRKPPKRFKHWINQKMSSFQSAKDCGLPQGDRRSYGHSKGQFIGFMDNLKYFD